MPNFDHSGPMGKGAMTGRKMGKCSQNESETPNYMGRGSQGKGLGRARSCGFGNQNRFRGGR